MTYAAQTEVAVSKTRIEIQKLVVDKHKATHFGMMDEPDLSIVVFRLASRNIRFNLPLKRPPNMSEAAWAQFCRSRWRALLLVIKAKLESVESKIETLEEAFLSQTVMPGGDTVYEQLREPLRLRYEQNSNIPLLQAPK